MVDWKVGSGKAKVWAEDAEGQVIEPTSTGAIRMRGSVQAEIVVRTARRKVDTLRLACLRRHVSFVLRPGSEPNGGYAVRLRANEINRETFSFEVARHVSGRAYTQILPVRRNSSEVSRDNAALQVPVIREAERSETEITGRSGVKPTPVRVFICYAREDSRWVAKVRDHLTPAEEEGLLRVWHDDNADSGAEWRKAIDTEIQEADAFVVLVSSALLASSFVRHRELPKILAKTRLGSRLFPVLVSDCDLLSQFEFELDGARVKQQIGELNFVSSDALEGLSEARNHKVLASLAADLRALASATRVAV